MSTDRPRVRRKLLMLMPELGYGGAESSFVRLSHLLSRHHDVTIALFARDYGTSGGYVNAGLTPEAPIVLLDGDEPASSRVRRWLGRGLKLRALKRDCDVTISFLSGTNLLNAVTFSGGATVVSERGSKRHDIGRSGVAGWLWTHVLDRVTYRLADRVVTVSHGLSREISQGVGGANSEKIVTVEGSIDSAAIVASADLPIEPELERLAGTPLIVSCGRLHKIKGFDLLIPIFAEVKKAVSDAKLLIVGDGPDLSLLLDLCRALNLRSATTLSDAGSADVIFLGHRENPNRYFRLARAYVLTSLSEGLPNALIEAMASGVPCIATDCPWGPRSVLALQPERWDGATLPARVDHGTLMPKVELPENRGIWVSTLVAALQGDPPTRATLSCRLEMVRRFDMNVTGSKWLDVIDDLCAEA